MLRLFITPARPAKVTGADKLIPLTRERSEKGVICHMDCLLEVPAVQIERQRAEVFREKCTRITINEESEFGPLGKYL